MLEGHRPQLHLLFSVGVLCCCRWKSNEKVKIDKPPPQNLTWCLPKRHQAYVAHVDSILLCTLHPKHYTFCLI